MRAGRHFKAAEDVTVSPSYLPHLVAAALDLLIDGECGIWHLANQGAVTNADFAWAIVRGASLPAARVQGVPAAEMGWVVPRPVYSVLASSRGLLMPPLDQAIAHYLEAATEQLAAPPAAGFLLPADGLDAHQARRSGRTTAVRGTSTTSAVIESGTRSRYWAIAAHAIPAHQPATTGSGIADRQRCCTSPLVVSIRVAS